MTSQKPTVNNYAFVLPNGQEMKALLNETYGAGVALWISQTWNMMKYNLTDI